MSKMPIIGALDKSFRYSRHLGNDIKFSEEVNNVGESYPGLGGAVECQILHEVQLT